MPCRHAPSFVLRLATVAIATLTSLALVATMASAAAPVDRLAGADRVETSVSVARAGWDQSDHVLLATAVDYPDAVAAAALASTLEAPVLLTMPDGLSDAVASAITDLDASTVTLLGGGAALSTRVAKDVRELGVDVRRIAGSNRYETAAKIAREVADQSDVSRVAIALGNRTDGRGAWPDALSAASLTGGDRTVPTLLTTRGELPDETRATLKELAPDMAMVLGGEGAVSDQVTTTVADLVPEVSRLRGPTRYDTAIEVAEASMANAGSSHAVFVSGEDFADALSGGALAARLDAPLLLVPGSLLDDEVDAFLRSDGSPFEQAYLIGGAAAVTDHVETELVAAMTGEPRPAPPCPENSSPDCTYTYRHAISTWERLAQCESGGNWAINTGNGYYGGIQFSLSSWRAVGGAGYPHQNSKWEQIHRGELLQARQGWGAWPACSRKLGLR
jgi:putative cell wall-binding protein